MISSPWKRSLLALFVALVALVAISLSLSLIHVDQYANISDAQAYAQDDHQFSALAAAYRQAEGVWQAGVTSAGYNAPFAEPATSWYVTPIPNPAYPVWQMFQPALIVLASILTIVMFVLGYEFSLCFRMGRRAARAGLDREAWG